MKDRASIWIPHFNISLRILSGPGAFLDFNNLMVAFVSFSVKGWSRLFYSMKFNSLFFRPFNPLVPIVTNINFLPMISVHCQETRLWELIKWSPKRKYFDLLSNSLNSFFKEIYRDQFGEFVRFKGLKRFLELYLLVKMTVQFVCWKSRVSRHRMCFSRLRFSSWPKFGWIGCSNKFVDFIILVILFFCASAGSCNLF